MSKKEPMAREILAHYGYRLPEYEVEAMCEIVLAHFSRKSRAGNFVANNAPSVKNYLSVMLADKSHECFVVMYLDAQLRVIDTVEEFRGSITVCSVWPRVIVKNALKHDAYAIMVAHNHPSGCTEPSDADEDLTRQIRDACKLVDIRLLDHFVVGRDGVTSFVERGLLI